MARKRKRSGSSPRPLKKPRRSARKSDSAKKAKAKANVLDRTCPSGAYPGDVYLDLNGEQWRAQQWGMAQVRLNPRLGDPEVHLPCVSLGDIGAASGAVGACLAIHDLVRGHAPAGQALVLSSSHGGEVGCLSFHSAGD